MIKKVLVALMFTLALGISASARDFTVRLAVQADDAEVSRSVEMLLLDQLRSLDGVLVKESADWDIRVMVMENKVPEGAEKSFTLTAVVTSLSKCAVTNSKGRITSTEPCDTFENFGIFAGRLADLKDMCAELIADFNSNSLEPLR